MSKKLKQAADFHRDIYKWNALKRNTTAVAANYSIDASEVLTVIDQQISVLSNELALYESLHSPLLRGETVNNPEETAMGPFAIIAIANSLPDCLIEGRLALGWSQSRLGQKINRSNSRVSEWENSKYQKQLFSTILSVAAVLIEEYQVRRDRFSIPPW